VMFTAFARATILEPALAVEPVAGLLVELPAASCWGDCRDRHNASPKNRLAADLMQNLGMFGFESRPLARRHNRDSDARQFGSGRFRPCLWHFRHA